MSASARNCILHVDDDPEILRLVARKLSALDFHVISLHDPTKAMESLRKNQCSVMITDIDMPLLNGLDLLQQVKQFDGAIQVIMLSGLVSMSTVIQSMRWGADACLFKPIKDFNLLVEAIDRAYAKIDYWWEVLRTLKELKDELVEPAHLG